MNGRSMLQKQPPANIALSRDARDGAAAGAALPTSKTRGESTIVFATVGGIVAATDCAESVGLHPPALNSSRKIEVETRGLPMSCPVVS